MNVDSIVKTDAVDPDWAHLAGWAAMAVTGTLALVACTLAWRRLDGALVNPLESAALAAVGLLVAMAAVLARVALQAGHRGPIDGFLAGGLSVCVLVIAIALSLPGSLGAGLCVLWLALLVEEAWAWAPRVVPKIPLGRRYELDESLEKETSAEGAPLPSPSAIIPVDSGEQMPSSEVMQQLTRGRTAEGADAISGWLRVPLEPGQRTANVHVAFCPPFSAAPGATVEQRDGPKARIKTVQLLPYGARFDLKLADPAAEATDVVLHFRAAVS